ncbi:MAG: UDP-N-acetylmuramoyl-L-alanyl-D-glutamate--2,6-diaminopimelate ligase [Desulfuromonas sp.]|nr:MAG: UDP-N-acetylmuramoyl-L-alanyl-D-glutamate--2,6-diaminopimelate ligase [Desulfuromonas sp.]
MQLADLIADITGLTPSGPTTVEVCALCVDSRQVKPGSLFFALKGVAADGHDFIEEALAAGASVICSQRPVTLPVGVTGIVADDGRLALAQLAARFFDHPTAGVPVIGVTGTNGKTTITYLLEAILREAGYTPAILGTVSYRCGDLCFAAPNTTPEPVELQHSLRRLRDVGADVVVMEVSSHALDQQRVSGINFSAAIFTNLTPEHLDYHPDMEHYFVSKRRLFADLLCDPTHAILNLDDPFGARLAEEFPTALTFSVEKKEAALAVQSVSMGLEGISAQLATPQGEFSLTAPLLGRFNLENLLGACGAALTLGIAQNVLVQALATAPPVPGRLERIENDLSALVLVDYAHTGDALEKALETLTALQPKRVITLFGCGGDRDRGKRQVMGSVAARHSDLTIVTSDNPRSEDPETIIADILPGVSSHAVLLSADTVGEATAKSYLVCSDRRAAIDLAVSLLCAGDLLLVAGKGHEDYQIIGKKRFHFDDREELRRALATRKGAA